MNDDRVTDRGVPSLAGKPIRGYRDQFFGVPGINRNKLEAHIAKLRLDGKLTENLTFTGTVLHGDYDKIYTNVFANAAATAQNGTVALSSYSDPTTRENFIAQANLIWDVVTGPIDHKVLGGVEYGNQHSANRRVNGTLSSTTFDLVTRVFPSVHFNILSRNTQSDVKFFLGLCAGSDQLGSTF